MTSVVITGSRYLVRPEQADQFGPFEKTFLAEGDSWMDASAAVQGSLPYYLAEEFNRRGKTHLIINISTSGQTLQRISATMSGDYLWWLKQLRYDAVLLSAGGNDFIDAARDEAAGEGLLRDMQGQPLPADGYECVRQEALRSLVDGFLNPNFAAMYDALRASSRNAGTPLLLNCYDTPVARNAPAIPGLVGPWLWTAYRSNHIDPSLWPSLTQGLFRDIKAAVEGWAIGRTGVELMPTTGVLTPASPDATGSSGDWKNEIHPNARGWRKQASIWADRLA
ncbi:SGNH/GDSL hydrolase family protein [Roseateles sp.]|uniref:SGNH/GDSL hydrolase family protein n=1 Tax=Roseateles sp. TaxID=1971397 RepID=UPI0039EAECC1